MKLRICNSTSPTTPPAADPMVARTETTALASAEKRRLSASYSDEATQHTKRACRTPLLQPDATENHPSPLTEWLDMALDTWVTNDATISLECPSSGLAIDEAPISYTDWQNSDACNANFDTSGYGERSPSGFNISSHNPQFDTTCSTIGQFGCDTEIVTGLNEADRVFWDDWSQPAVMDVSYEPENHRSSEALPNIHPTAANLPLALKSHLNSDDLKKNDTAENIQLEKPDTYSDTCFGVIYTNVTTSFTRKQDTTSVPVRIEPSANFLKFYFQDSNKYAGLITLPVLNKLLMDFDTKLDATLNRPQPTQTTGSRKKDQKTDEYRPNSESSLRIVVKGTMKEASNIGKLLSDAGFYLQHPSADDCDMDVEYFNPHYLVRPGSHMPRLGELDISSNDAATTPAGALDETSKSRLMRIFDSAGDDNILPTTAPSPRLRSTLKRHQLTALAMMSERECGLVEAPQFPLIWEKSTLPDGTATYRHRITRHTDSRPSLARGGILADEMGLGKTLSTLALICWSIDVLQDNMITESSKQSSTLIVTPKSTIHGWIEQIRKHILPGQIRVTIYHGPDRQAVASSFRKNDIILTTYETLRSEFPEKGPLYTEDWFRVVLDEAHHIGNRSTMKFQAACGIQALRRWCLTGTPIHNSLDNYGALLSFVGVAPFIEKSQFAFWIANPIKEEKRDSWKKLQLLVRSTSLRRTKQLMDLKLPPLDEKIEHVELSKSERELYEFFRQQIATVAACFWQHKLIKYPDSQQKDRNILSLINLLRLVCNNENLLPASAMSAWRSKKLDAVNWRLMESSRKTCVICKTGLEESLEELSESTMGCEHSICASCSLKREDSDPEMDFSCPECSAGVTTAPDVITPSAFGINNPSSSKIASLLRNLHIEQAANRERLKNPPIKSVVFSYWTKMLDLIEKALHSQGYSCQRVDGRMNLRDRATAILQFAEDPSCTVMLATISSAGEGIDLTAANFVHVIEPHWNPMVEAQAIARVHRIGQPYSVVATKYVTRNSVEEYVRWIQEDKLRLIAQSLNSDICQKEIDAERWKKLKLFLGRPDNS